MDAAKKISHGALYLEQQFPLSDVIELDKQRSPGSQRFLQS